MIKTKKVSRIKLATRYIYSNINLEYRIEERSDATYISNPTTRIIDSLAINAIMNACKIYGLKWFVGSSYQDPAVIVYEDKV